MVIFNGAIFYYFWGVFSKERGLFLIALGNTLLTLGIIISYITKTPFVSILSPLLDEQSLSYIRQTLYIAGGVPTLIGIYSWFPRVANFRNEVELRKKAQNQVRDKTDLIAEVLESSKHGILLFDENYLVQLTNRRFLEIMDLPEELGRPGTSYKALIEHLTKQGEYGSDDVETIYQQFIDLAKGQTLYQFQRKRSTGTYIDIEAKLIPGIGWLSTYTDITQQIKAERERTISEEKFRDFSESASDWFWELNTELKFIYISELGLSISGRPTEDIYNISLKELLFDTMSNDEWSMIQSHLKKKKPFKDMHFSYHHPDGSIRHFSLSGKPVFNKSGVFMGYRGIGSDITIKKHFEEQLQNSQKMEAIGRLSGGIAHDFNNLLAIIVGNAELIKEQLTSESATLVAMLDVVEKAAMRGADLTQQMLSYSRRQTLSPTSVNLVTGMEGIVSLIGRSLGADIEIKVRHSKDIWLALCDLGKLEDAIINLANNARDAMPNGGMLTITTSNYIQKKRIGRNQEKNLQPGNYVVVSVKDTGTGISNQHLDSIFEPFYTTKEVGKGTGLGLSMVFGFAKQSNGHVAVDSEENVGTIVNLFLPCASMQPKKDDQQLELASAEN